MTEAEFNAVIGGIVPILKAHITKALGDMAERVASAESRLLGLAQFEQTLGGMRDRLVAVETKAAQPDMGAELRQRIEAVEHRELPIVDQAPVLERLSAAEARLSVLGDVRDRIVAMETKSAIPPQPDQAVGEMRERLLVLETKAAAPVVELKEATPTLIEQFQELQTEFRHFNSLAPTPSDHTSVLGRLAAIEDRLSTIGDLRDKVITLETKAAMPMPSIDSAAINTLERDVAKLLGWQTTVETKLAAPSSLTEAVREQKASIDSLTKDFNGLRDRVGAVLAKSETGLNDFSKDVAMLRDRLMALEVKSLIPGPPGAPGRDGMTLDDLSIEQEGDRTLIVRGKVGGIIKEIGRVTFPVQINKLVWTAGKEYERGDCVTRGGGVWHCNAPSTTAMPGDGSKDWTLIVKPGRDGKDFRETPPLSGTPVVRVGNVDR